MQSILTLPIVSEAIAANAAVAIGVSGGKDSQAAALATIAYLDQVGHTGPRILIHSDLGIVEWAASIEVCRTLAAHLGLELVELKREAGGLMDRWRARWASSVERYKSLSTVTVVLPWSTPDMRFCTSELKTKLIQAYLKRRFPTGTIINVTGVRRDESVRRAKGTVADLDLKNRMINWRPLSDWTETDVFAAIDQSGLAAHPAYRRYGMRRVSCIFCIYGTLADIETALQQEETHQLYREMVALEADSGFAFQGARWLGDVRPDLMSADLHRKFVNAKRLAEMRQHVEAEISKDMLYVSGWPTRMLTDEEADRLAVIRRMVSNLYGWDSACLDRDSIHQRYAQLIEYKAARVAAKEAQAQRRANKLAVAA